MKTLNIMKKSAVALAMASAATVSLAQESQQPVAANPDATTQQPAALENTDFGRWYISPGIGWDNFEGDEPLEDGMYFTIRLGYDYSEWWTLEGSFLLAPTLDENLGGYTRRDAQGNWYLANDRESYSKGDDTHFGDTWMTQVYGDALFHFSRFDRIDPYFTGGVGLTFYGNDVIQDPLSLTFRAGGGIMYHLSDSWSLRLDSRIDIAGYNTEFNHTTDMGFVYRFTADKIEDDVIADVRLDSDGDRLYDDEEVNQYKTDPNNPDTDGDALRDGDEVYDYKTDPLNPDTDGDQLKDGAEVQHYKTDPLNPDTDADALKDGEEVLSTKTDPLNPDTDADGLKDGEEVRNYKTDALNPDTDGDGLMDGDEVHKIKTDPLNPDSDYDLLSDGAEVIKYKTNPLDADTDDGGVRDGHEIIYDHTDPLYGADDVIFFELNITFDTDKSVIKPEFFPQLNKVAAVMLSNPGSTAVVEGHADKRVTSSRKHNIKLSGERAASVAAYLASKGIDRSRLSSIGYGYDHPKVKHDMVNGTLANRRVEVYIDGASASKSKSNYVSPTK